MRAGGARGSFSLTRGPCPRARCERCPGRDGLYAVVELRELVGEKVAVNHH
jgi:hypothetical protein